MPNLTQETAQKKSTYPGNLPQGLQPENVHARYMVGGTHTEKSGSLCTRVLLTSGYSTERDPLSGRPMPRLHLPSCLPPRYVGLRRWHHYISLHSSTLPQDAKIFLVQSGNNNERENNALMVWSCCRHNIYSLFLLGTINIKSEQLGR